MTIHDEHPFRLPPEQRDSGRRFRGRLASGVTVVTSGPPEQPVGMTASSVTVAEGEPWRLLLILSDTADIYDAMTTPGRFVVQLLDAHSRQLADRFAGLAPAPGGMFKDVALEPTDWGVRLTVASTWAGCAVERIEPVGNQHLVVAAMEHVEVHDLTDPLLYFRGGYRRLGES